MLPDSAPVCTKYDSPYHTGFHSEVCHPTRLLRHPCWHSQSAWKLLYRSWDPRVTPLLCHFSIGLALVPSQFITGSQFRKRVPAVTGGRSCFLVYFLSHEPHSPQPVRLFYSIPKSIRMPRFSISPRNRSAGTSTSCSTPPRLLIAPEASICTTIDAGNAVVRIIALMSVFGS